MARCRWRRVLLCLCMPCCFLVFLYISLGVLIVMNMTSTAIQPAIKPSPSYFIAPVSSGNASVAHVPKTFWEQHVHDDAFWNKLQRSVDHHFNHILYPNMAKKASDRSNFSDYLLKETFSKIMSTEIMKNLEKLPMDIQDFITNMQRRDYPVLIQPRGVCGVRGTNEREPPLILLAIKSTELNYKNRKAIRETWGRAGWVQGQKVNSSNKELVGGYVRRVFLLGKESSADMDVDISDVLRMESQRHGDILQWDFKDTFFNITLKDVLFWSWFAHHCDQARFILKGDDDVFVNTPKLIAYLHHQFKKPEVSNSMEDFMMGEVIMAAQPNRDKRSKYFIPPGFYKGFYPMYAGGGGVVYSGLLARRLLNISRTVHLFPIDDVYVGMCMVLLNAHPLHHPAFLTFDRSEQEEDELCSYHTILLVHKRSPKQLVRLWAHIKKTQEQCQDVPLRDTKKTVAASAN
ncbi:N-acetyllactosaminide beta-1,3-N-acetylglucosaminyltransferase 2 [Nematolebias whitei]|uniref:N-acetyllactosaminide beta-1,3-N-acetylglucosaminyltransferase 2 n=1 Tax=Nematolebias whitei TaxID=451745 RepID=UPI001896A89A|nr:N-acetyllactosaminide beta-1,3-N-acetylglucosaminyltransferase 2 [Nematolebias whitei]